MKIEIKYSSDPSREFIEARAPQGWVWNHNRDVWVMGNYPACGSPHEAFGAALNSLCLVIGKGLARKAEGGAR